MRVGRHVAQPLRTASAKSGAGPRRRRQNWSALKRERALEALAARSRAIEAELARLGAIQVEQQPLPDFVEAVFEYSLGQLRAEATWVTHTPAYMTNKPWLE